MPEELKARTLKLEDLIDRQEEAVVSQKNCSLNIMTERPSFDEYFLGIAYVIGKRATCLRSDVGAVIVRDKHILSTGYNGAPSGMQHCLDIGCIRDLEEIPSGTWKEKCRAVHAEQNAIIQAAIHGISITGATIYCTHQPCMLCAKIIINSNIKRVVYSIPYRHTDLPHSCLLFRWHIYSWATTRNW